LCGTVHGRRASQIIALAADRWRNDQIAARLAMPRQVVGKRRKLFFDYGFEGMLDLPQHDC
jgi:hypothetical protein